MRDGQKEAEQFVDKILAPFEKEIKNYMEKLPDEERKLFNGINITYQKNDKLMNGVEGLEYVKRHKVREEINDIRDAAITAMGKSLPEFIEKFPQFTKEENNQALDRKAGVTEQARRELVLDIPNVLAGTGLSMWILPADPGESLSPHSHATPCTTIVTDGRAKENIYFSDVNENKMSVLLSSKERGVGSTVVLPPRDINVHTLENISGGNKVCRTLHVCSFSPQNELKHPVRRDYTESSKSDSLSKGFVGAIRVENSWSAREAAGSKEIGAVYEK